MKKSAKTGLLMLFLAFGADFTVAAQNRIIHDWTLVTPLGEFGYVEIGGDGFPTEGDFLFGSFGYVQTGVRSSTLLMSTCLALLVAIGVIAWSVNRRLQTRR